MDRDTYREGKGGAPALFILSFTHRDALTRAAEAAGWRPLAARRPGHAERRFLASGAAVAVVDARGRMEDGLAAIRDLAEAVEASSAALLAILDAGDDSAIAVAHAAGATHFLVDPFTDETFIQSLRFAERHVERVAGYARTDRRGGEGDGRSPSWRWRRGSRTVTLSPALARSAGFGAEARELSLFELFRLLDRDARKAARRAIAQVIDTGETTAFAHAAAGHGARLAHHLSVGADKGIVFGHTETLDRGEGLHQMRDPLTGVRDARAARAWIDDALAAPPASGPAAVMLLLSVSRFDAINAAFGRATGDEALQAAARRIERLADDDQHPRRVARMSGTSFAVLLPAPASLAEGRILASELVASLGRPFLCGDNVITLGWRAGVVASEAGDDAPGLIRRAGRALAEAKSAESAPVRVLPAGNAEATARDDRLDVDLRRALDRGEIDILFQPQVSVTTAAILGVEALARWRHPEHGELGAATLFSVAERSDYLVQLSGHVQRRALELAAAWPNALGGVRMAVNITAADMARSDFAEAFLAMVEGSGFPAGRLTVEVTESGLIEDLAAAATLLARLREGGLRVAIDDFGTGYSSLAYLKALPLDYLKLDKRLVEDIAGTARDRIVVRSVIGMARSLGLDVIAEGVETEEQLALLAEEGCALYQGFLCAPPLTAAALADLMRAGRS